jgi:hypothetical protein
VDSRVVVLIREFLLCRKPRLRVGWKLSEEVRITSGVPKGSVLVHLLFLVYVNDIWRNMPSTVTLFANDCIYRKVTKNEDMENCRESWTGWGSGRLKLR